MSSDAEIPGLTKGRVEALSDGIFATAMTILVLGLSVPVITSPVTSSQLNSDVLTGIEGLAPNILSYVLSFLILTTMWVSHHNLFHYVSRLNRPLTWLNALFLLTVGFIPFSTALLGKYPQVQWAVIIYGGNIVGTALAMQVFIIYSTSRKLLTAEGSHERFIRSIQARWRLGTLIYFSAIILSFVNTEISVGIYVAACAFFVISSSLTVRLPRSS